MEVIKLLLNLRSHHFDADIEKAFVQAESCHKSAKEMMFAFKGGSTGDFCKHSRTKFCANTKNNLGRASARKIQNMMKCGMDNAIDASTEFAMKQIAMAWGLKEDLTEKPLEGVAG